MTIKQFIQNQVFLPRLQKKQVLVVYDPDKRYRSICLEMATNKLVVVDASESSITSRAFALDTLSEIGKNSIELLLVYIPAQKPIEEEEKQKDPFALYLACGSVFPDGDGDSYLSICLRAKPDFQAQIREVFDNEKNPLIEVIDAIGGGLNWPNLRVLLKVESSTDILFSFLYPTIQQQENLKKNDTWYSEIIGLFKNSIGLNLKTKVQSWSAISDELWRYLLFSEFVSDLPVNLPESLKNVPHAQNNFSIPLIESLCDRLRSDRRTQSVYIQRAESIEKELLLESTCSNIHDLGVRDTFPFEERTFFRKAVKCLIEDDLEGAQEILSRHSDSVWTGKGESQIQWDFLGSSIALIKTCYDNDTEVSLKSNSMEELIDFYVNQFREVDQRHREFEQSVSDFSWQSNDAQMNSVIKYVRNQYTKLSEKVQKVFIRHLQITGWPLTGRMSNNQVFDKLISPKLEQSGKKIAFIVVDALRYELGVELVKQISEVAITDIIPALAQLPTITKVGMASLLPGASSNFKILKHETGIIPEVQGQPVGNINQRMDVFKRIYGIRFYECRLEEYVRDQVKISPDADLLVLRSVEIDSQFENNPDTAPLEIMNALKRIRVAINKLTNEGYSEAIIASDHGFFLNTNLGLGDTCSKPPGNWINIHNRSLMGEGQTNLEHFYLPSSKVGINSEYKFFSGPLSHASYKAGLQYFHGGCSLQECIVPIIIVKIEKNSKKNMSDLVISLSYKNNSESITTRFPVIEVEFYSNNMFTEDQEVLIEAQDKDGKVVGESKTGGIVSPSTGTIILKPGTKEKVTIKMSLEFEGKFWLVAQNPVTLATFSKLELETNYII